MKKIIVAVATLCIVNLSFAQCGKDVKIFSKKVLAKQNGEWVEMPADITLTMSNESIILSAKAGGESEALDNKITEVTYCKWDKFLYNGKAVYKVDSHKENDATILKSVITIESVDGETTITCMEDNEKSDGGLQIVASEYDLL